jgi:cytochrome c oxidase assembly protein subunit 15
LKVVTLTDFVNKLSKGNLSLTEKIKRFQGFVLASTLATYLLIFIGGLVRVSGAGLGCPDWPKCFGRWIPPLHISQIPQDFNPASFNLTLAWIEYINRLAGMVTGIFILVTALLALKNFRHKRIILIPSMLAAMAVALQGWYGSIVVKSQLLPLTVSVHLILALFIVSLLLYTLISAYHFGRPPAVKNIQPVRNILLMLWIAAIIQVVIGTEIRSSIEMIWQKFPLLSNSNILPYVGAFTLVHALLGVLLSAGMVFINIRINRLVSADGWLRQAVRIMNVLILLQLASGFTLQVIGFSPLIQVFHLWIASLFIGLILVLYTSLSYQQENL